MAAPGRSPAAMSAVCPGRLKGSFRLILATVLLTYSILGEPTQMERQESDAIIQQALETWAQAGRFQVRRAEPGEAVAISISWEYGRHDPCPVDFSTTRVGMMAHTYFPPGAEIHFNRAERWDSDTLLAVAIHEIGHALGLEHSEETDSVMWKWMAGIITLSCEDRALARYLVRKNFRDWEIATD
jgi:hypothetical protein